jgi:hypothetical protein
MSSGHQIFGLVLFFAVMGQLGIGFWHHRRYRKFQKPTIYGRVHLYTGPAIVLGGIINGFTGFNLSGESHNNVYYGPVVAVIVVTVVAILGWKQWSKRKQNKSLERAEHGTSYSLESFPVSGDRH